jgi:hypothetical protein
VAKKRKSTPIESHRRVTAMNLAISRAISDCPEVEAMTELELLESLNQVTAGYIKIFLRKEVS